MKNLTIELKDVFSATGDQKRIVAETLINNSHAKTATKTMALFKLKKLKPNQIDMFMTNYVLSGEGMKVS